ncbi:MAG TPA: O-antigen ligase family protein [Plantibacter sp.]|uniref:O-antigen ligase family protein n=1 Tax=unclassified Plantibacter TaxID=2624265 RepID=UPI002C7CA1B3|nr:O-antigen ligase family protein [Plantibacter sp.]
MLPSDPVPPRPPEELSTRALVLRHIATFATFAVLAGTFWTNLLTIWGYTAVAVLAGGASLVAMLSVRPKLHRTRVPWSLVGYGVLAVISLAWSAYPSGSAATLVGAALCTVLGVFLATCFSWPEVLRILGRAVTWLLSLSLAFEFVVAALIRHPVLPNFYLGDAADPPLLDYWSRDLLFSGGRIQGLSGNANLLAVAALLGLIIFAVRLAALREAPDRSRVSLPRDRRWTLLLRLGLATAMFLLSFSTTILLAAVVTVVVLAAAVLIRRAPTPRARTPIYLGFLAAGALSAVGAIVFRAQLLGLLGKSPDLTGRLDIWNTVRQLIVQRPVFGWGFSSPWAPWEPLFTDLVIRRGVRQLQAHNAWLDVWFQLGVVGLILFSCVVLSMLTRSWFLAVDRPRIDLDAQRPYSALSLAPILIGVSLVVQSVAESRILIESGWVLLVLLVVKTKQEPAWPVVELPPARRPATRGTARSTE